MIFFVSTKLHITVFRCLVIGLYGFFLGKMNGDTDKEYFDSYDDLEVHRLMLCDTPRTESYRESILKNQDFFKGKVVMDVGAGQR